MTASTAKDGARGRTPWNKEPMVWLLIALPTLAVIGSILTIWIAASKPDPLVSEEFKKEGMAVEQIADRERRAAELAATARLHFGADSVEIVLSGHVGTPINSLRLSLIHPSEADLDRVLTLTRGADAHYRGTLPMALSGKRKLVLEPDDAAWRLTGQLAFPYAGELLLAPAPPHSSTRR
jgi:hypothetical protein